MSFTFVDLFAGIGGFRRGFESAGGECVASCEWDKFARKSYIDNYGDDTPFYEDINDVEPSEVPDHDVLLAGFPCQPFSKAGPEKGFSHPTQGTLFFNIVQILKEKRPKAFVLENVKNLQSHNKGETFKLIMKTLTEELGYHVQFRVMNAVTLVPQKRERIIIVGFRDERPFDINNINLKGDPLPLRSILEPIVEVKYTLTDNTMRWITEHKKKHVSKGNGFGYSMPDLNGPANTLIANYYKDARPCMIEQPDIKDANPRRLTPRECARLMGFPEEHKITVSNTQAYKQFGNSVVVPLMSKIAKEMKCHL